MKLTKLIVSGLLVLVAVKLQAQVSVNVNIGGVPPWGPQVQADIRYYYLPDIQAYYDVNRSLFVYIHNGRWVHKRYLPARFRHYDLYRGRKVVVHDYSGNYPYSHCNYHKVKNKREYFYGNTPEKNIKSHYKGSDNYERSHYRGNIKKQHREGKVKFAHFKGNGHKK